MLPHFDCVCDRSEAPSILQHCVYECIDAGAFYVGRSWAQRGNVVRFNTFDTVRPTERLAQGELPALDPGTSGL